jgi:hypothetical protein
MELKIVNPDPRYSRVTLTAPTTLGYLHLGADVRAPSRPGPVFVNRERSQLVGALKLLGGQLERVAGVRKVTVYEATAFAPPSGYVRTHRRTVRPARFDVAVLVETQSPQTASDVRATPQYRTLHDYLGSYSRRLHAIAARNIKRIGDVDKTRRGTFLFNYFVGDDPSVVIELWDYLAGWYAVETGLDNSTLLAPLDGERSDYVVINHARWDGNLVGFVARQLSKKSFRTFVLANLEAHNVGAMPVLYRLA